MTIDNSIDHHSESERKNIALMRRWFNEVWNDRRIETIHEFLSPDFVSHYEHTEIKGSKSYKEQLFEAFVKAIPDLRIVIDDIIASGNYVVTRWQARGVHSNELLGVPPSGKTIEFNGMAWTKIVNGKITENWTNWNMNYLLNQVITEIEILKGILPICASCKKIRDDKGYWNQVETYIESHSGARFSHGLCEECANELYGNQKWYKKYNKKEKR
jgi:steroid delta-isomerase-like uncharacterized protein